MTKFLTVLGAIVTVVALFSTILSSHMNQMEHPAATFVTRTKSNTIITANQLQQPPKVAASKEAYSWQRQKQWLCPRQVPNLTAAAETFYRAQQVFLPSRRDPQQQPLPQQPLQETVNRSVTDRFFSFWPGHVTWTDFKSGQNATIIRTKKCGSLTVVKYLKYTLNKTMGRFKTSLHWRDFFPNQSGCVIASFRDPVSHFISGYGEIEIRRAKILQMRRKQPKRYSNTPVEASYEAIEPIVSKERVLGFVEFLLTGEWLHKYGEVMFPEVGHVFPQSGHLRRLHNINRGLTSFIPMTQLNEDLVPLLQEKCHLSDALLPIEKKGSHAKVQGMDDLFKSAWAEANQAGAEKDPILYRALEAICLLNAVDYACLADELERPPPPVCRNAFAKYLQLE